MATTELRLPERAHLVKTNEEDPLDYYYVPLIGHAYRRRLQMACELLPGRRMGRVIEIGCGSGILLPELAARAGCVYAADIHANMGAVLRMMEQEGLPARLQVCSVLDLPYRDGAFEGVVCLSVLEHMDEHTLPQAVSELRRVTSREGAAVVGFPVRNVVTSGFYRLVGFAPAELHPSGHQDILNELRRQFRDVVVQRWPAYLPPDLSMYMACRCAG